MKLFVLEVSNGTETIRIGPAIQVAIENNLKPRGFTDEADENGWRTSPRFATKVRLLEILPTSTLNNLETLL